MKQVLDNVELIKEKVLKFETSDDLYMISILKRKKDHPTAQANENSRMLANFYIKNIEYFDRRLPAIKEMCEKFQARAYIKPQVRSCKAINRQILKFMVDQIDNTDLAYSALTREIISGFHSSRAKRMLLDLDGVDYGFVQEIQKFLITKFKEEGRETDSVNIFNVPTFNGYHIILPGFNPSTILQHYSFPKDTIKSDADTILYAVKEVSNN